MMVLSSQSVLHTAYSAQIQGIRSRALAYRRQRYIECLSCGSGSRTTAQAEHTDPKPFVGLHRVDFTALPGRPLFSRAADKGPARMHSASLRVTAISEEKLFMQTGLHSSDSHRPNIQNAAPNSDAVLPAYGKAQNLRHILGMLAACFVCLA